MAKMKDDTSHTPSPVQAAQPQKMEATQPEQMEAFSTGPCPHWLKGQEGKCAHLLAALAREANESLNGQSSWPDVQDEDERSYLRIQEWLRARRIVGLADPWERERALQKERTAWLEALAKEKGKSVKEIEDMMEASGLVLVRVANARWAMTLK